MIGIGFFFQSIYLGMYVYFGKGVQAGGLFVHVVGGDRTLARLALDERRSRLFFFFFWVLIRGGFDPPGGGG